MKKFEFSMQRVLEFKTHMEDREKAVLAKLRQKYDNLCSEMEGIKTKSETLRTEYEKMCRQGILIKEMAASKAYMAELNALMTLVNQKIKFVEMEINCQITKITEISKDKRIFEKLKERHLSYYKEEQKKAEEIFIEDFVANTSHYSLKP